MPVFFEGRLVGLCRDGTLCVDTTVVSHLFVAAVKLFSWHFVHCQLNWAQFRHVYQS